MRIAVSGAGGLIGSALTPTLAAAGHQVIPMVRPPRVTTASSIAWDPAGKRIDRAALDQIDAVVHLSGETILGRWTKEKRRRIIASRVGTTQFLAATLAALPRRPQVLVCVSAIGYYGDRGDETLTEQSAAGSGFFPDLCREWEGAAGAAADAGIRVVHIRTSLVLAPRGGVLGPLWLPFRLGVGGPIGRGLRWWSWIASTDLANVFRFALETPGLAGPVNATAPHPVRNGEFAETLGRVVRRPAVVPVPPVLLRLVFGREAANEAMLVSARVAPARLQAAGFQFRWPELEPALRAVAESRRRA